MSTRDAWTVAHGLLCVPPPTSLKPKDTAALEAMQSKELNNGRLAMIAMAGMVVQELVTSQKLFGFSTSVYGMYSTWDSLVSFRYDCGLKSSLPPWRREVPEQEQLAPNAQARPAKVRAAAGAKLGKWEPANRAADAA